MESSLDTRSNERSSSRRIHFIVPVFRSDNDSIVANVVSGVANDEYLGCSNEAESLVTICVSESNNLIVLA